MDNNMLAELDEVVRLIAKEEKEEAGKPLSILRDNEELDNACYWFMKNHHGTLADMAKRLEALQSLAAAMYQAAGAYDMPVRFLDVLSAAGNGEPITEEQVDALLPCGTPDTLQRLEAAERDAARIDWLESKAHMLTWNDNAEHVAIRAEDGAEGTGESWREAIDAAIDATQEGEG